MSALSFSEINSFSIVTILNIILRGLNLAWEAKEKVTYYILHTL